MDLRRSVVFDDPVLEAAVRSGLDAVEEMLRESVKSNYPFVTETSRHLVDAGGKRFRPLLVLLASQFGDPTSPGVVPAAVAIELTHLSTLYHDDVMDEATLRRGTRSANSRWDNTVAILTGDFLFARASEITADLGTEATRILAQTIAVLCEGQIRETLGPGEGDDPVDHYLSVLAEKTGSLIATSGRLGALLAGAPTSAVDVMTRYGATIGLAFQLSDDLLDVASETVQSGKTPGTDLREGIRTLPVLYALRLEAPDSELARLLTGDLGDDDRHAAALAALRNHPAMDEARATLAAYSAESKSIASELPDTPARAALVALADFVVARTG
ncbi:MAG TPA: polyprenyl synthetase family protein [Mycobacteriales bacterium]|jgi:heptaprenyl diphosphate synthase|nr:polyprenyl synthetase family protein [Mycobacteriales bacterium]